jgi:outer membrane protein assembly factor BamB
MEPLRADDPRAAGEFRLRARLGAGGMGRVYLGMSPAGRAVAVKVVHPELARDNEFLDRFRSEVAAAQSVSGIYTAAVVATGVYEDPPWLATAYVPGPTLQQLIDERGPLPEAALWRLTAGLAEAIAAVHAAGLIHRDLKPNNVLAAEDGPRVIDFGVSRALDGTSLTRTGLTIGTPPFMSPEQARGQLVGPASDVFSLGAVLCFAATGQPPFGDGNAPAVLYRVVHEQPALDGIPGGLRDMIAACLAKDPAARPTPAQLTASLAARTQEWDGTFWPAGVLAAIRGYRGPEGPGPQPTFARVTTSRPSATTSAGQGADAAMRRTDTSLSAPPGIPSGKPGAQQRALPRRRALAVFGGLGGVAVVGLAAGIWELNGRTTHTPGAAGPSRGTRLSGATSQSASARTRSGSAARRHAAAVTKPSGTILWQQSIPATVPVLTMTDGGLYAQTDAGVYGYDARSGKPLWMFTCPSPTGLTAQGGTVFWRDEDAHLYAADSSSGTMDWRITLPEGAGPLAAGAGQVVYVSGNTTPTGPAETTVVSAASGKTQWQAQTARTPTAAATSDGVAYLATPNAQVVALGPGGTQLWSKPVPRGLLPAMLTVADGVLLGCGGDSAGGPAAFALDATSGSELWQAQRVGLEAVALTENTAVYYANAGNNGELVQRNARAGTVSWIHEYANVLALAVLGGTVLVGIGDNTIHALDNGTGKPRWTQELPSNVSTIATDGVVICAATSQAIYGLQF